MTNDQRWAWVGRVGLALLVIMAIIRAVVVARGAAGLWADTPDDAFITFRYAEHLARGWGLTFNPEPPRAEGYTSLLWTLLMAPAAMTGVAGTVSMLTWSKVLGAASAAGMLVLVAAGVATAWPEASRPARRAGGAGAVLAALSFPSVATHTVSGMETALAAMLYAAVAYAAMRVAAHRDAATWPLPVACLCLGITRPEANLFCVLVLAMSVAMRSRDDRIAMLRWVVAAYVAPMAVYVVARAVYYGLPFPLPFYIKATQGRLPGLRMALAFLRECWPMWALGIGAGLAALPRRVVPLLVPAGAVVAYFTTVEQIMGFQFRFFYPVVPVVAMACGLGIAALVDGRLAGWRWARVRVATWVLAAVAVAAMAAGPVWTDDTSPTHAAKAARSHIVLGQRLKQVDWVSARPVLGVSDAGAVPYYSAMRTVDLFGLNDAYLATHRDADRGAYLLRQNPTVVVLISNAVDTFVSPLSFENDVYRTVTRAGFATGAKYVFDEGYVLWVLWRPDGPDADALGRHLRVAPAYGS